MKVNLGYLAVFMGLLLLIAVGCAAPEQPAPPAVAPPVAPPAAPPAEKPAAPPVEQPVVPPAKPAEEKVEAPKEEKIVAVETNVVKLVQANGDVSFEENVLKNGIKVKQGSTVTFRHEGVVGFALVAVVNSNGKPLVDAKGKKFYSGKFPAGAEWTTQPFATPGTYSMQLLWGKKYTAPLVVE